MSAFNVENQPKFNSIQFAQTVPVKSTSVRPLFGATKTKDQAKLTGQLEKDFPWTKDIKPLKTTSISVDEWFYKKSGKEEIDNKITEINKKISQLDKQAPTNKSKLDKLEKQISELEKKRYKTRFTLLLSKAFKKWNADRVAQNKANKHLPREFKKRIFWYKTTTYWWKKWFSPSKAKCKLVTLQGPIAIKAKQAFVQSRLSEVEQYEKQLESINTKVKRKKLINETLKDFDKDLKNLDKKITETDKELKALDKKIKETKDPTTKIELTKTKAELTNTKEGLPHQKVQLVKARKQTKKYYPILLKVAPFFLKRFAINPVKHYEPLLNAVEPSNFKIVEPKIKNVLEYYNKQVKNDKDKIELSAVVKKAVKSGSIGQVHVAKTKSGQKKIIKITRPDANKDVLNKYNKYLYVINMNKFGTASDRLYLSAKEADNQIDLMRDEINATVEFENYQKVQKSIDDLNIHSFKTPKVDAATKDGLIMDFVGDKDFANLSATDKDKALKKIGPELIKLMILSPIKNLDYHDGNVRVNSKNGDVFVIDCGRVSDLKAEKHTQLLKLYVLQATNSSSRNFVLNNETLGVVKALLSDGSEKTNLYKSVETLEHKLSEQNPRVYQLSETKEAIEVGSFLHDILSMSSISTTEEKNKTSKKLNTKHQQSKKYFPWFDTSTLLNTWGNYFNLSNENTFLPQLSSKTKNISTSELKDIQAKNLGMLKSYFNSTILTQEEKQIEKEASTKITKKNKTAKLSRKDLKRQAFDDVKQHRAEKLANNFVDELLKTADLTDIKDDDDKYTELKKAVKKSLSEELNTHQAII